MNIAICDDEERCLKNATDAAKKYASQKTDKLISVESFSHPEDLIDACEKKGGYDIYILDVVMPDMNGISLGEKLRELGFDGKIIYLTSSEEYSLDAFRVKAFDYLIKPINEEAFFRTVDEALAHITEKNDKYILVKSKERSIKLSFDSIMYAELSKRAVCYHLTKGKTVESVTLRTPFTEACADLLSDKRFFLCSQSMLVNLDHVTEVENEAVVFLDAHKTFLGEKSCRKLRSAWSEYLFS
ncbi:MAG: response regulator transcription factor [Clostridia bacterium]|nr:response regulator transcription factor [Clostridia bacterium]